jgi:hypothetical protein
MTKTFHGKCIEKHMDGELVVPGMLVVTLLMVVLLQACASIPHDPNYDGASDKAERPRCTNVCWVLAARNDNYFEARVYINGQRAATLPGMMAKAVVIPITRSMLDAAGCMVVFVKLYPDTKAAYSSNACPVPGSRLELGIDDSYAGRPLHLWLQDWRKG